MSLFITNQQSNTLGRRLRQIIKESQELNFLVGFFYFSGINEVYEELKQNPELTVKILVGLNVDQTLFGIIEHPERHQNLSKNELFEHYLKSVTSAVNSEDHDEADFYEKARFFLDLIISGRLHIRKTVDPNHAKLYIFKFKEQRDLLHKARFITGSSNLTKAGLYTQGELNIELSDFGTDEACDYFDKLWDQAVPITEDNVRKKRLIDLIQKETLLSDITPFEAYTYIIKSYLDLENQTKTDETLPELLRRKGYEPFKYQLDAVSQALTILNSPDSPDGVIISDVVGLGKSIIASLIAKGTGKRGIIICPPGLVGDENKKNGWNKYKEDFELYNWEIRSCGKLESVLELVKNKPEYEVIIIDEAHRFRNEDTEDYEILSSICKNKKVLLLTATPFNNSPADIFSMLKLFVIPGKSKISLDNDLSHRFREYNTLFKKLSYIRKNHNSKDPSKKKKALKYYQHIFGNDEQSIDLNKIKDRARLLANTIRQVIEPILIRRNRIDLKKDPLYSKEIYNLPVIADPEELFYKLSPDQFDFYARVLNDYFGDDEDRQFKGAIYQPFRYETGDFDSTDDIDEIANIELLVQSNLYDFMRRLLVKRFESSFGAFRQSVQNFYNIHENVLKFIKKSNYQFILDRKLIEKLQSADEDEIEQALKQYQLDLDAQDIKGNYKVYEINKFKLKNQFLEDIESDKKLFKFILNELDKLELVKKDPKLKALTAKIDEIINTKPVKGEPERKIVIFTEYLDTAQYLSKCLEKVYEKQIITSTGNFSESHINKILSEFDASWDKKSQGNQARILLTTDRMSEGFNLNRAGTIINYDIPWNPTRVIQRVGRINRIGKKVFSTLYICNFFPTLQGSEFVKSREIAQEKMFMIHNTLGEDAKIFDPEEEPTAAKLYKKINQNPEETENVSFQTKLRIIYNEIQTQYPEVLKRIQNLPTRVKTAKQSPDYQLISFIKKGLGYYVRTHNGKTKNEPSLEDVFPLIKCPFNEPRCKFTDLFWNHYQELRKLQSKPRMVGGPKSLETKARHNLNTFIQNTPTGLEQYLPFIRTLLEDIHEFKTLPEYTLRTLASFNLSNPSRSVINAMESKIKHIMSNLGEDYLNHIKEKSSRIKYEVIVAIENTGETK